MSGKRKSTAPSPGVKWFVVFVFGVAAVWALDAGYLIIALILGLLTYGAIKVDDPATTQRSAVADRDAQHTESASIAPPTATTVCEAVPTQEPVAPPQEHRGQRITVHRTFTKLTPATSFIAFDFETTGLSPTADAIIEVGAVKYCDGEVAETFSCFVDPKRPVPSRITQITGITNRMVKGAKTIYEVMPAFLEFIGDMPLVAHNARFDADFLANNLPPGYRLRNQVYDNLAACRETFPYIQNHKLPTVISHLGIKVAASHRALDDAKATAQIFFHCLCQHRSSPAAR